MIKIFFLALPLFLFSCKTLEDITSVASSYLGTSQVEAGQGIKEALAQGIKKGAAALSLQDGYFKNEFIKILLPVEAQKVATTLSNLGMKSLVDKAVLSLNRAAENAASKSLPIFKSAIASMTIADALSIVKSSNQDAATTYLKNKTETSLREAFSPVISNSLSQVGATKYWRDVFSTYNKIPLINPVNPDLTSYVTEKALDGLFKKISDEEKNIRTNPLARTTALLKKVFGMQ